MRITLAALLLCLTGGAQAQHNHGHGHHEYQNWSSGKVANCCNRDDCGGLQSTELRETATGPQVLIAGEWCPVLREHYLTRGKSPDWSVAHVCVGKNPYWLSKPPCERLLCFLSAGGL